MKKHILLQAFVIMTKYAAMKIFKIDLLYNIELLNVLNWCPL